MVVYLKKVCDNFVLDILCIMKKYIHVMKSQHRLN